MTTLRFACAALLIAASIVGAQQPGTGCNAPTREPMVHVTLPGNPFTPLPSADGCWIFVTLAGGANGGTPGVAVLKRDGGAVTLAHVFEIGGNASGAVLTHDGRTMIVTAGPRVVFLDTRRMIAGARDAVIGAIGGDVGAPGRVYVNVTRDDRTVFVSDENVQTITVIDLAKARRDGFSARAIVGRIPTGRAPIALTFSPDERYLYTTSQTAPESFRWPVDCRPQGSDPANPPAPDHTRGAILVVDVERARTKPENSIVAAASAGCNPVRLILSAGGDIAYVTARTDNVVQAFDTKKLISDSAHALIGAVPVGTAPVGLALVDSGRKLVVTNSNRFAGGANDQQFLTVVDAAKMRDGASAVLGVIPAGAFPRELRVTADERTLLLTNFASRTLQVIDLARLPIQPAR